MSLKIKTAAALNTLSAFAAGQQALEVTEPGQELRAAIIALDAIALAFDHVTLTSAARAAASIDELKKIADTLSKRLTYLLEPISPIEIDADQCVVQLRSNPPARDDNGTRYYELLVRRGGELSLRRFQKQPGGTRRSIPAQVTR